MVFVGVAFFGEICLHKKNKLSMQTFVLLPSMTILYAYLMSTFLDGDAITYDVTFFATFPKTGVSGSGHWRSRSLGLSVASQW